MVPSSWISELFQDRRFGEDSGDVARRSDDESVDPLIVDPVRPPVGDEVVNGDQPSLFRPIVDPFAANEESTADQT